MCSGCGRSVRGTRFKSCARCRRRWRNLLQAKHARGSCSCGKTLAADRKSCKSCLAKRAAKAVLKRAASPGYFRALRLKHYWKKPEKARERSRRYRATCGPEARERERERGRHRRAANPEKIREQERRLRAANREKIREQARRYRAANLEKIREQERRRRAANLEKIREQERRRRAANREKFLAKNRRNGLKHRTRKAVGKSAPAELMLAYQQMIELKNLVDAMPEHGTRNTYANRGCRCEPCRSASNAYMKERKK